MAISFRVPWLSVSPTEKLRLGAILGGQNNLPFREYTHRTLAFNDFKAQNI